MGLSWENSYKQLWPLQTDVRAHENLAPGAAYHADQEGVPDYLN